MAFIPQEDLAGPGLTIEDAAAAVGQVLRGIAIIDSRISDWKITIIDTIADKRPRVGWYWERDRRHR